MGRPTGGGLCWAREEPDGGPRLPAERGGGHLVRGCRPAIRDAVARANRTLRNLDWFQVSEIRGVISGGEVAQCQVTLKLGFRLEE